MIHVTECVNDPVVSAVMAEMAKRDRKGFEKYGTTTADNPLDLRQWLQHALEETLDKAVYLKRAIVELDNIKEGKTCTSSPIFASLIATRCQAMASTDNATPSSGGVDHAS